MGLVYSVCTNYELGLVRGISMRTHLGLDYMSGALLALSPWLFGFSEEVYLPHVIMGLLEIGVAAVTDPVPSKEVSDHRVHNPRTHTAH